MCADSIKCTLVPRRASVSLGVVSEECRVVLRESQEKSDREVYSRQFIRGCWVQSYSVVENREFVSIVTPEPRVNLKSEAEFSECDWNWKIFNS